MKITTLAQITGDDKSVLAEHPWLQYDTLALLVKNHVELGLVDGSTMTATYQLPEAVDIPENFLLAIVLREDRGVPERKGFSAYYVVAKKHIHVANTETYLTEEYVAEDFEGLSYEASVLATKALCRNYSAAFWDHTKPSSKLKVLYTNAEYEYNSFRYGIDPDNLGYEVVVKGGTMLSFNTGWFGTGWSNEISTRLYLPDRLAGFASNTQLQGVLDGVREIINSAVPYENLADDNIDIYEVRDFINKTLEMHQHSLLCKGTTSPFKDAWWFYVDGDDYEPVEVLIRPILREALRDNTQAFVHHTSMKFSEQ